MNHPLLNYVLSIIPPERGSLYKECDALLHDFYPDGWPTVLEQILNQIENQTVNDIEMKFHEALIENLQAMVLECNLDFNHRFDFHHNLQVLYDVAYGLFHFEHFTDIATLDSRFRSSEEPIVQVAMVLSEVKPGLDEHTYYEMINHVSPTVITKMEESIEERLDAAAPVLQAEAKVEVIQHVLVQYAADYPELLDLPHASLGGSFDSYVALFSEHLLEMREPAAAHAFMLAVVLAQLDQPSAAKAVPLAIQHVYSHDLRRAMRVMRQFSQIAYPEEPQ